LGSWRPNQHGPALAPRTSASKPSTAIFRRKASSNATTTNSDRHSGNQPKDPSPWDLTRFVEEVAQVRLAFHPDPSNFYLLGHSWGGMLAIEYALKYQSNLTGLIVSNMIASIPAYVGHA
jgi:pimeloyl-ACP methyl ester carboxylesterase